ncbi:MAG: ACP S-malonyltransferase [Nitrospirae bacterium]|nr:ACP S-malonyltransferase [Nitrospirota bacterium]
MNKTSYVFPGQGSQYIGMGSLLYDKFDSARRLYNEVNDLLSFDLKKLCREGPAEELNKDANAQIAVYVNNYIHLMLLKDRVMGQGLGVRGQEENKPAPCPLPLAPMIVTGYSLGFYSALAAGGAIDFAAGLSMVKEAERLMEEEIGSRKGGMIAIIGLLVDDVEAICNEARKEGDVWISNINAARQIIVSGMESGLRAAEKLAQEKGALHVVPINVGLPFHTPLMKRAGERFFEYLQGMDIKNSEIPIVSYMNGQITRDKDEIRKILAEQLYNPVMWKDTIQMMINNGINTFIEVGPERALYRMIQWIDRKVKVMATEDILI